MTHKGYSVPIRINEEYKWRWDFYYELAIFTSSKFAKKSRRSGIVITA